MSCRSRATGRWVVWGATVCAVSAWAVLIAAPSAARAAKVYVDTWDGRHVEGQWAGLHDGRLTVRTDAGQEQLAVDDLMRVALPARSPAPLDDDNPVAFFLADGMTLFGRLADGGTSEIKADCRWAGQVTLPLDALAAVRFSRPGKGSAQEVAFDELLADRPADHDVLIGSAGAGAQTVSGVLLSVSQAAIAFRWNQEELKIAPDRLYGLVLARGVALTEPARLTVTLRDGTKLTGDVAAGDEVEITLTSTMAGGMRVPLAELSAMEFTSERVVFAADLPAEGYRFTPYLNVEWAWRANRSAANGPIVLDGRRYARGIGMHSQSELTLRTDGAYATFAATVGIDDAVRPLGAVVFRVLADQREVFNSGPVGGADPARTVSVPVAGAERVTLAVDFGPQTDVADHADWADARFVK